MNKCEVCKYNGCKTHNEINGECIDYEQNEIIAQQAIEKYIDLTKEVGIDLETYVKIQTDGFYGIVEGEYSRDYDYFAPHEFAIQDKKIILNYSHRTYELKDQGKTWDLTEED